jgi:hypothetical protein
MNASRGSMATGWEAYDPAWLVELARAQHPEKPWLASALSACTRGRYESRAYIHFVDAARPGEPGSPWQFRENVLLHALEGDVVLDVLEDGAVGGAEFLWLL